MWLSLIQLMDSAFPTGAFSHSFGLETAVQEGRVTNIGELEQWLKAYVKGSIVPMEGACVYWAYHAAERRLNEDIHDAELLQKIRELDQRVTLSKLARESREGTVRIGKRYLHMVQSLYPDAGFDQYEQWIQKGDCYGNAAVVHGWVCAYLQLDVNSAVTSFMYTGMNSLVQNAMRTMSIWQTEGQKLLKRMHPFVTAEASKLVANCPPPEEWFTSNILQEIDGMRHETLYSRLFMS